MLYAGKSEYCYANSLYMCLAGSGADLATLPEPGFLECLTLMPFGSFYLRRPVQRLFFPSPAAMDPETGLDRALEVLGWTCQHWWGQGPADRDEAIAHLRSALATGPALVGPVDIGLLAYNPRAASLRGGDHFVVALQGEGDAVILHDPYGYPYARISLDALLDAWQADAVDYKRGPFTLRWAFQPDAPIGRSDLIARTLALAPDMLAADPSGPVAYGGPHALQLLAADLRGSVPDSLAEFLTFFSLAIGARRRLDASRFCAEGGRSDAAAILDSQAHFFGAAQALAATGRWSEVADVVASLAATERELLAAL